MDEIRKVSAAPGEGHILDTEKDAAGSAEADDSPRSLLGEVFGHIRIVDVLGSGGMGTVYLGKDEKLDRRVAVKAIRRDRSDDESRARFLREAQILSRLNHPNICQIHDIIESAGSDLLILELVEGRTLRRLLADRVEREPAMDIAEQLASVLVFAHAQGIIHRDLKPENVMLTGDGTVKVLDFGLARSVHSDMRSTMVLGESPVPPQERPSEAGYTTVGAVMGTIGYMSPEQARGETATAASDLHSLGLLLQEVFTGQSPFDRNLSADELLQRTADGQTEPVIGLERSLTRLLEDLKAPAREDRPAATEVVKRLHRIRSAPARRLRRTAGAAIAVALVLLGLKYTFDLGRERQAAVAARDQVEELMDFMVDDVYEGLEPLGRLDLLERVADQALDYYNRSADEAALSGDAAVRRIQALRNLGCVLHLKGDSEAALDSLDRSLVLAEARLAETPGDADLRYEAAETRFRIGFVRLRRNELDPALECFAAIDRDAASLPEADRRHLRWQELLASVQARTAVVLTRRGEYEDAIARYERARTVREALVALDSEGHAGRRQLGTIYDGMATLYLVQGRAADALPLYVKAEEAFAAAVAMSPTDLSSRYGLATTAGRRGEAHVHLGDMPSAQAAFEHALQLVESLAATDPADTRFRQELAVACARLSDVLLDLGREGEALPLLKRAIAEEEALVRTDPGNLEWTNNLAYDLIHLGVIQHDGGDGAAARSSWQRAVDSLAPMAGEGAHQAVLDTYATGLIHLGRLDEARAVVRGLVDAGWSNPDLLELAEEREVLER